MDKKNKQTAVRILNRIWCFAAGILLAAAGVALIAMDIRARTDGLTAEKMTHFGVIGTLLLIAGGSLCILHLQARRGAFAPQNNAFSRTAPAGGGFRVPPEGYLDARIIGITRNLRTEGGREGFHVVCRYQDPSTGAETTFTSDLLPNYPGKEVIGRTVRVMFPGDDPDDYHVDLSSIER